MIRISFDLPGLELGQLLVVMENDGMSRLTPYSIKVYRLVFHVDEAEYYGKRLTELTDDQRVKDAITEGAEVILEIHDLQCFGVGGVWIRIHYDSGSDFDRLVDNLKAQPFAKVANAEGMKKMAKLIS